MWEERNTIADTVREESFQDKTNEVIKKCSSYMNAYIWNLEN